MRWHARRPHAWGSQRSGIRPGPVPRTRKLRKAYSHMEDEPDVEQPIEVVEGSLIKDSSTSHSRRQSEGIAIGGREAEVSLIIQPSMHEQLCSEMAAAT